MATFPTTGQKPWGAVLKAYIDDLVNGRLPADAVVPDANLPSRLSAANLTTPPELAYAENTTGTAQAIAASATGGGGNFTDITGCIIVVPVSTRPVYLSAAFTASLTAAPVNSLGLVFLRIVEVSNGVDTPITWQAEQNVGGAGQFASVTPTLPPRRLGTTARIRTFKLQVGDYQAAVSVTNSAQSASFIAAEAR